MIARRRRDPRAHHEGGIYEDVQAIVDGQPVTWHGEDPVDVAIIAAHQTELDRIRPMWGLDMDDWLLAMEELVAERPDLAVVVARKWCDIAIAAAPHDDRHPDHYGFSVLANAHHANGDHQAERDALEEWLRYWPADRETTRPNERARVTRRLERGCQ